MPAARCAIVLAALLVGALSVASAWAQVPAVCPEERVGHNRAGSTAMSLAVAEQLEHALNAADPSAPLALFADDAVAASSSSKRWQGVSELRDFVTQLRNPTAVLDTGSIDTYFRCAVADQVVWLFTYPSGGGSGSADLVVRDGRITHIFWTFEPPTLRMPEQANASPPRAGPSEVGASFVAVLGLALSGSLVLWSRRSFATTGHGQRGLLAGLASHARRRGSF
jgi:hypothetical protein